VRLLVAAALALQPSAPPAVVESDPCRPLADSGAAASVAEAERAFARLSVDSGAQAAFLANLADSAVLFRPAPVPGRAFQLAHPIPQGAGTLAWTPHWAGASRAGDLGFTSGPWTISRDGRVVAHGTFNSVWRRPPGGRWQVLFDVGVGDSTAATAAAAIAGVAACGPVTLASPAASPPAGAAGAVAAVLRADTLLGRAPADPAVGYAGVAAADARLVREHRPVVAGAAAVRAETARAGAALPRAVPLGAGAAASGDLAYSYGTYEAGPAGGAGERGHYLRVWRAAPRGWALVLDVTNALPPARPRPAAPPPAAPPAPSPASVR
jgi:ketosteroid isomerase-like protein